MEKMQRSINYLGAVPCACPRGCAWAGRREALPLRRRERRMGTKNGNEEWEGNAFMFFYHLGKIAVRYRWWIVFFWLVAAFAALPFAPQASQILHPGGFVSPDAESQQALDMLVQKLHVNQTIAQVLFTSKRYTVDDPPFLQQAQQSIARLRNWSEVAKIVTFVDNPRQVSLDRHAAYVNVA